MKDDGTVDQKHLFMNVAEIGVYNTWAGLAKRLKGGKPTSHDLIDAQIEAYRRTRKMNPSLGFNDEPEFETWICEMRQKMENEGDSYLKAALPVYDMISKTLTKK